MYVYVHMCIYIHNTHIHTYIHMHKYWLKYFKKCSHKQAYYFVIWFSCWSVNTGTGSHKYADWRLAKEHRPWLRCSIAECTWQAASPLWAPSCSCLCKMWVIIPTSPGCSGDWRRSCVECAFLASLSKWCLGFGKRTQIQGEELIKGRLRLLLLGWGSVFSTYVPEPFFLSSQPGCEGNPGHMGKHEVYGGQALQRHTGSRLHPGVCWWNHPVPWWQHFQPAEHLRKQICGAFSSNCSQMGENAFSNRGSHWGERKDRQKWSRASS